MTASEWIGIAGLIATPVIGFLVWLVSLSNRVGKLETKVEIFWESVSFDAAKILHSPHPERARLDRLIELYLIKGLIKSEFVELKMALQDIIDNTNESSAERGLASTLLRTIDELGFQDEGLWTRILRRMRIIRY